MKNNELRSLLRSEKLLKADKNFVPCTVDNDDEIFQNGIFQFNITKLLEFIHKNPKEYTPEKVAVKDFYREHSSINESFMDSVIISDPVILAEIAPGKYNLIDGNHRMEKARRSGRESIMAYRINVNDHIKFLTTYKAYIAYVEYWNGKLEDLE